MILKCLQDIHDGDQYGSLGPLTVMILLLTGAAIVLNTLLLGLHWAGLAGLSSSLARAAVRHRAELLLIANLALADLLTGWFSLGIFLWDYRLQEPVKCPSDKTGVL